MKYYPDNWVLVKLITPKETLYKVLGGWSGSYLEGTSWRLNSGIKEMVFNPEENVYEAYGYSDSVYILHPVSEGHRMATAGIVESLQKQAEIREGITVEEITLEQYLKETQNE
tara:strand:- start:2777 stop:3115 length:339 start_codon:yes stop_codon:yes gene_type:complete